MNFKRDDYLPLVSVDVKFKEKKKRFNHILLDTKCSLTILDTDLCEEIGLLLDLKHAITCKLYGIGGTEICIEQKVSEMAIGHFKQTR